MGEKFLIEEKKPLEGEVEISGAKNNAGPVIAATLLTKDPCIIENLPEVEDVFCLLEVLKKMGSKIEKIEDKVFRIENKDIDPSKIDFELISKTRISVLLIAPLLARFGILKISKPGGDRIGVRPITTHLEAFKELGAKIETKNDLYFFETGEPKREEIVLREFSVTATENLMMFCSQIEKETKIFNAATEPHVQDLGRMLNKMGAKIEGIGTHQLTIRGKKDLKGVSHRIIPDHIETGTFFVIGAVTPGKIRIKNFVLDHLRTFLAKMEEIGVNFKIIGDSIEVDFSPNLSPTKIQALPWPGFPTDLLPIVIPLLTQASGKSLVHDPLYEARLNFVGELKKMGADIEILDPHRVLVFGKNDLFGIKISSWDIRAGASLLVAALLAKGKTTIDNVYQIDRGYEKIDEKLRKLGANIRRVK